MNECRNLEPLTTSLTTPVALIVFNRPDVTQQVFARVRQAKPEQLFVIADAPRPNRTDDEANCAATRKIVEQVNWDCQVKFNYAEQNLGCRERVASGLNWLFEQVPEAIILEDDCLPQAGFFGFCQELLAHYRQEPKIWQICGSRYLPNRPVSESYYFSQHPYCWGWATWRRVWQQFDLEMSQWPKLRDQGWLQTFLDPAAATTWQQNFEGVYHKRVNTWDYQWVFACWLQQGLSIVPAVNLIANIGFAADATHTLRGNRLANLPTESLDWPLTHPAELSPNYRADDWVNFHVFNEGLLARLRRKLPHRLPFDL